MLRRAIDRAAPGNEHTRRIFVRRRRGNGRTRRGNGQTRWSMGRWRRGIDRALMSDLAGVTRACGRLASTFGTPSQGI
jgi:hypothetical protein